MLVLTRKVDEVICVGDDITVMVVSIRGNKVQLGVSAPRHIAVDRGEIRALPTYSRTMPPITEDYDAEASP